MGEKNKGSGRNKSDFLSGFGTAFQILKSIIDAVLTLGGTDEDLHRLLTPQGTETIREMAALIVGKGAKAVSTVTLVACDIFKIVVDYGKTLDEMEDSGKYGYVNNDISDKHFPIQGAGQHEVKLVLVHLNRNATTGEVLKHLNALGLEPAKIEYLLAFGTANPDVQREFPIVALGSVWVRGDGACLRPYLGCFDGKRRLSLSEDDNCHLWGGIWRFLALRK